MKRKTFKQLEAFAKSKGMVVQRGRGREIEYWYADDSSTTGIAYSVDEAWDDINENFA